MEVAPEQYSPADGKSAGEQTQIQQVNTRNILNTGETNSNPIIVHYVIERTSAMIQNFSHDANQYKSDDTTAPSIAGNYATYAKTTTYSAGYCWVEIEGLYYSRFDLIDLINILELNYNYMPEPRRLLLFVSFINSNSLFYFPISKIIYGKYKSSIC
jgi:hypothetical protein